MAAHHFKEAPKRAHFLLREYASHLNNQSQAAGSFLNQVCNRDCMYHYFLENFLFLDLLNLQDFFPSPRDEKLKMRNRVNVSFHIIFFVFFFLIFMESDSFIFVRKQRVVWDKALSKAAVRVLGSVPWETGHWSVLKAMRALLIGLISSSSSRALRRHRWRGAENRNLEEKPAFKACEIRHRSTVYTVTCQFKPYFKLSFSAEKSIAGNVLLEELLL